MNHLPSKAHVCAFAILIGLRAATASAADIQLPANGNLQAAIDIAQGGDTILLAPGATYVGNFVLPPHRGTAYITIRSAASNTLLPAEGARMTPAYAAHLPKIISPNTLPVFSTLPQSAYWRLMFLEIGPTNLGYYDIIALGDGSGAQTSTNRIPHHFVLDRLYIHGHPVHGQKRGVQMNAADVTLINSHVSDIKAVGQDTQAVGGWTGPGPFTIQNNYLEATGEVILFGGADPSIMNLVPSDLAIVGNTITRPLSWRGAILATPATVQTITATGGALPAGSYAYRVVARKTVHVNDVHSSASVETSVTVSQGARVTVSWSAVPGALSYDVYRRIPGGSFQYWSTSGTAFVDDGTRSGAAGVPPTWATTWQVKNLLELKNARRVRIEQNVLAHNWASAQAGIAVLFTPRNQDGTCSWCVVEDVTFDYNVVRGVGGAINILGYDYPNVSRQTRNIRIRNNLFADISLSWGGAGYFLLMTGKPRDIVIDHNTIISPDGSGVLAVDGPPIVGFVYTNNVARHNLYGFIGTATAPGTSTIATFFQAPQFGKNILADNLWTPYPAGFTFPSAAEFEAHFVDYGAGDYRLKPGTDWQNAGTDGKDLGASFVIATPTKPGPPNK